MKPFDWSGLFLIVLLGMLILLAFIDWLEINSLQERIRVLEHILTGYT